MILKEINAIQFRNYAKVTVELPSEGALFHGVNGAGKTNLLEAISFAILGKSPRGSSLKEMITLGEREAFVKTTFESDGHLHTQSIGFSRDKQIIVSRDDISISLSALYGENRFIYFGPDDVALIVGTPEEKRKFIDLTLSQVSAQYLRTLIQYRKLLKQRNYLLTGYFDSVLCDVYDKELGECMHVLVCERTLFFREIKNEITQIYHNISERESKIVIDYQPSVSFNSPEEYEAILLERRSRDRENGYTSVGPHRDSFKCKKDGRSIVGYGSQGQCRSSALALKIASTSYLTRDKRELILAVDDAFSDLDRGRREKFFAEICDKGQLFIAVHSKEELGYYPLPSFSVLDGKVEMNGLG